VAIGFGVESALVTSVDVVLVASRPSEPSSYPTDLGLAQDAAQIVANEATTRDYFRGK
jgi:hypothetical protein